MNQASHQSDKTQDASSVAMAKQTKKKEKEKEINLQSKQINQELRDLHRASSERFLAASLAGAVVGDQEPQ